MTIRLKMSILELDQLLICLNDSSCPEKTKVKAISYLKELRYKVFLSDYVKKTKKQYIKALDYAVRIISISLVKKDFLELEKAASYWRFDSSDN